MEQVADGVWRVTAGSFPANSYVVATGGTTAVLVDAGLDAGPIDAALGTLGLTPGAVLCTHGHFDHIGSASFFQNKYGCPVHLHRADMAIASRNNFILMAMKLPDRITLPRVDLVEAGSLRIGGRDFAYRHTPGHTPGSCVVEMGDQWFTGDTVYARGLGLSQLPGERHDVLRETILGLWPDLEDVVIHPGHGASAAGAAVRSGNTSLRQFLGLDDVNEYAHAI